MEWRAGYTPGDRLTSWVYSTTFVQYLYISCYLSDNKPVLLYLLLRLLPQWWPQRDWSLWPYLRRASSRTITRPSCRQCDNPTWFHTALLSLFHAHCRSSFRLHNPHSRLLGGEPCGAPAISLHSHTVSLVQWVNPLLPVMRNPCSIPRGGTWVRPGFSC